MNKPTQKGCTKNRQYIESNNNNVPVKVDNDIIDIFMHFTVAHTEDKVKQFVLTSDVF